MLVFESQLRTPKAPPVHRRQQLRQRQIFISMSGKAQPQPVPAPADIQAQYNRFKNELQAIASKIGELESDIEEHE